MNAKNTSLRKNLLPSVLTLSVMAAWSGIALAQADAGGAAPAGSASEAAAGGASGNVAVSPSGLSEPTRGVYYRLSQSLRFEDNLFRRGNDQEDSDMVSTTSATVGTRLFLSRQVLNAEATVLRHMYRDNDQLDGNGYRLNTRLQWEIGSNWAGKVQAGVTRDQVPLDQLVDAIGGGTVVREQRNQESTRYLNFDARYGLFAAWSLDAFGDLTSVDYSIDSAGLRERDTRQIGVGVRYKPSPALTLGVRTSYTDGEYPDDDYDRKDLSFTVNYLPGDRLSLRGNISYTDEQHDNITARDFSGLTGSFNATYALTSKINLEGGFSRQTNSGATASERIGAGTPPGGTPVLDPNLSFLSDARVTNTLDFGATWAATSKIAVRGKVSYSREDLDRTLAGTDETTTIRRASLNASWAVHRIVGLSCELSHAQRDAVANTRSYSANTFGCTASVALE